MHCPYSPPPVIPDDSTFSELQPSIDAYHQALADQDVSGRAAAIESLTRSFQGLRTAHQLASVSLALLSMTDLTATEITQCASWLPAQAEFLLVLCSHPGSTERSRVFLGSRTFYELDESGGRQGLLQHLRMYHPLALAFLETRSESVPDWPSYVIDAFFDQMGDDLSLHRVAAGLLDAWEGTADDLVATARGITTNSHHG